VARGYLHLLETQAATNPAVLATVEQASRAATRMAELLDEVSEYARWARGEPSLTLTPTSLREVLATVASRCPLPLAPAVHVDVDAPADISLPADAPRLARALSALASTVARAHPRDRAVTLALWTRRRGAVDRPRRRYPPASRRRARRVLGP
jgi:signal transduction histidine kinase